MTWNIFILYSNGEESVIEDYDKKGKAKPAEWESHAKAQAYVDDARKNRSWQAARCEDVTFIIREASQ